MATVWMVDPYAVIIVVQISLRREELVSDLVEAVIISMGSVGSVKGCPFPVLRP